MNVSIGIDPGLEGAVAVVMRDPKGCIETSVYDMPVSAKLNGKGNQVDAFNLAAGVFGVIFDKYAYADSMTAFIEQVGPMPKQGVTGVFSFGRSLGVIEGIVAALQLRTVMVRPASWKKRAGLQGKDKDAARTLAIQMWPELASQLARKKDVGRADALLIAHFGAQEFPKGA